MTAVRAAVALALVLTAVAVGTVLLGSGGGSTRYRVELQNAGQLVKGNDVQVGGRRIGSVRDIRLADDNRALLDIEVSDEFAPLHAGTTAIIRATSLSGVANRYVALAPGPQSAPALEEGALLGADDTTAIVDLDQLFNTLDPETRTGLQRTIRGLGDWYDGRGEQANAAARLFNPALSTSRALFAEVTRDEAALRALLQSTARTSGAIAGRRDDLAALVGDAGATSAAIASESEALNGALNRLPGTLRKASTTFVELRGTLDDLDVLVAESKPATKDLARFLRELRPVVAGARPTIADLRRLVRRPGSDNDLIELLRRSPALQRAATPAFAESAQALRRLTPVLGFARPYAPDLMGWLRGFGQGAANYDANGHFARVQPIFNAFQLPDEPDGALVPRPPAGRLDDLVKGQLRRCPGAAAQVAPDRSNVWRDEDGRLDCDPNAVVPGP